MPQLDISTYVSQLFWLAITFGILYFSLSMYFLPKLTKTTGKREKQIADLLKNAESMRAEAANIEYDITLQLDKIKEEAKQKLQKQVDFYNKKFSQEMYKLDVELADKTQLAESRANQFQHRAYTELEDTIVDITTNLFKAITNKEVSHSDADQYVKAAVFDMTKSGEIQ